MGDYKKRIIFELSKLGLKNLESNESLMYYLDNRYNIDFIVDYLSEDLAVEIEELTSLINKEFGSKKYSRNGGHEFFSMKKDINICSKECSMELDNRGITFNNYLNKCHNCEDEFIRKRKSKWCSEKCRAKKRVPKNIVERSRNRRKQQKQEIVDLFGGKCSKCEYNKCLSALEFHHVSGEKDVTISKIITHSIENIKKELEKCILLCSNCHYKEHSFINSNAEDYRNQLRSFLTQESGSKCSNCKESDWNAFDFHHIVPEEKEFSISKAMSHRWDIRKIVPEVNKCTLLCRNCHREHHSGLKVNMKPIMITEKSIEKFLDEYGDSKKCRYCIKSFKTKSQKDFWCSEPCKNKYLKLDIEGFRLNCNTCNCIFGTKSLDNINCKECRITDTKIKIEKPRTKRSKKASDIKNVCKECTKVFYTTNNREYCSKNCMINSYETHSIEEVKALFIKNNGNMFVTASELGLSDNAVKKRLTNHAPELLEEYKYEKININCKVCNKEYLKYNETGNINVYCSDECRVKSGVKRVYDDENIKKVLKECNGSAWKAHKILNIPYTTLREWKKKNT